RSRWLQAHQGHDRSPVARLPERWCVMNTTATTQPEGSTSSVPSNGQPASLVEVVEHEALGYRAWGTPEGDFLARYLARLAQLIHWTGAPTPQEHEARMEVWKGEIVEHPSPPGSPQGWEAARRQCRCGYSEP